MHFIQNWLGSSYIVLFTIKEVLTSVWLYKEKYGDVIRRAGRNDENSLIWGSRQHSGRQHGMITYLLPTTETKINLREQTIWADVLKDQAGEKKHITNINCMLKYTYKTRYTRKNFWKATYLVKLKCVPIELLCQHVPLFQNGFVIVCIFHDCWCFWVSQHLPHVAFKTSDNLCNLWFTSKVNRITEKVNDRRKLEEINQNLLTHQCLCVREELSHTEVPTRKKIKLSCTFT